MGVFTIEIGMKLLLVLPCLVSLAMAVPVEILSYSAAEEKHDHKMEGVPGEAVMGDPLPVSVIMDPVPEVELPAMVDYTPEVAAARADFLKVQEEIMAKHAAEENMVEMERKKREAEPVVVPTHTNLLPTTYHHLAGAYPVYYNNPYLTYPIHQVRAPIVSQPVYTVANNFPVYRILPQVATDVSATIAEGDDEPAALAL